MEKPITIQIEDTKKEIIDSINNSKLPIFTLEAIIKDIYNEIRLAYQNQLVSDRKLYEKSLQEEAAE